MPRATTTERSRPMKRTRNGILIPDVPIMAGGNLPNAVKGVSGNSGEVAPNLLPFYIDVHTTLHLSATAGLEISQNAKDWRSTATETLTAGRYYFRSNAGVAPPHVATAPGVIITEGELYDVGGNLRSLATYDFLFSELAYIFQGLFQGQNIVSAHRLYLPPQTQKLSYGGLFKNCVHLEFAPDIFIYQVNDYQCANMFRGCTNLRYIKCTTDYDAKGFETWVTGVATEGTFVKKRGVEWPTGVNGIPTGWAVEEVD